MYFWRNTIDNMGFGRQFLVANELSEGVRYIDASYIRIHIQYSLSTFEHQWDTYWPEKIKHQSSALPNFTRSRLGHIRHCYSEFGGQYASFPLFERLTGKLRLILDLNLISRD